MLVKDMTTLITIVAIQYSFLSKLKKLFEFKFVNI